MWQEELVLKVFEFLESPHITTEKLTQDDEQVGVHPIIYSVLFCIFVYCFEVIMPSHVNRI